MIGVRNPRTLALAGLCLTLLAGSPASRGQEDPEGLAPIFSDDFESGTYFNWSEAITGAADRTRPLLFFTAPAEPVLVDETMPVIELSFYDYSSGIALESLRVELDGGDLLPDCTVEPAGAICATTGLSEGIHSARASIFDLAGNSARSTLTFEIVFDVEPPVVEILSPAPLQVLAERWVEVSGTVSDDGLVAGVVVNGQRVVVVGGVFQESLQLAEGLNAIEAIATDSVGRTATASIPVTADTIPPVAVITAPEAGSTTNSPSIIFTGEVSDATSVVDLQVNGISVAVVGGEFSSQVSLSDGLNAISIEAADEAGNVGSFTHTVTLIAIPGVEIETPANPSRTSLGRVTVQGTVAGPVTTVTVAGIPAQVSGGQFLATDVPLLEGVNPLTAVATAPSGAVGVAVVTVVRDSRGPRILVELPGDGSVTTEPEIPLRGLVLEGGAGSSVAAPIGVTINGLPAEISGNTFFLPDLPLAEGANSILIEASDDLGNLSQKTLSIHRDPPASTGRLSIVAGNFQVSPVGAPLAAPLEVLVSEADGTPVPGVPVVFSVRGNNGSLGNGGRRQILVTAADGKAAADFVLGTFAGVGSQVVKAEAVGFGAGVQFFATSTPEEPARVVVDSGSGQVGMIGRELADALVVVATDPWSNRLPNVPVEFAVTAGGGSLVGFGPTAQVMTDATGRAFVSFELGPDEGRSNNVVEARLSALPDGPVATFVSSGFAAGLAVDTSASGVVLDNTGLPVPGVEVRVPGTPLVTTTDSEGEFFLAGVPVGSLELHVDGSTTSRPGSWPSLELGLFAVAGRENFFGRPIYLLPLETTNVLAVDDSTGGVLELSEVPGFSLEVAPGSVTFPGGGRTGVLSVTPVHVDKVPMEPNFGQQPRFIVTIQPAGAVFDPPARLSLPNVEGFEPGEVSELYSFDHDAGRFVSIGLATTSDDATVIVSNPGVGVVKAGWHCGGNPSSTGTPFRCPQCKKCSGSDCVADSSRDGTPCERTGRCETNRRCLGGTCIADRVRAQRINGPCIVANNDTANFTVVSNDPGQISWLATGGNPIVTGQGPTFALTTATFPDSPPSRRNISAYCALPPATKRLWVGPSCSLFVDPPILESQLELPLGISGIWGAFKPETNIPSITACVDIDQWCPALVSYKFGYSLDLNFDESDPNSPIPLSGPDDAINITPETCIDVLASIAPQEHTDSEFSQGEPYAEFYDYIYLPAVQAHEEFHLMDYRTRVVEKTIADFALVADSHCQPCGGPKPDLFIEFNDIRRDNVVAWKMNHESAAHIHSNIILNKLFEDIVDYIEARPDAGNFPPDCRLNIVSVTDLSEGALGR